MEGSHTYQSGHEIFEKYIPGYKGSRFPSDRQLLEDLSDCSAASFVESLLKEFSQQLAGVAKNSGNSITS
jgi:hypothetical protein